MVELIVLDVFGTLLGGSNNFYKRPNAVEFLNQNPEAKVTLYTDAERKSYWAPGRFIDDEKAIRTAMDEIGLLPRLTEPFFYNDSMDGRFKDLSKVAKEFGVNVEDLVMVGDASRDRESAQRYGSKLVLIPALIEDVDNMMPMDKIGNLDELLKDHKAARFFYENGSFQQVLGDYEV